MAPTTSQIAKLIAANARHRRVTGVWDDFVLTMSASYRRFQQDLTPALVQQVDDALTSYSQVELERFRQAHDLLVDLFEDRYGDHLGQIYMELPHGGEELGQYFSPYDVATLTAALAHGPQLMQALEDKPTVRVHEPACGAGAMLIALADLSRERGVNFQQRVIFDCEDIELTSVHMAHVQLSIIGAQAIVRHRDTLTGEQWDAYRTPFYRGPITVPPAVAITPASTELPPATPPVESQPLLFELEESQ